MDAATTTSPPPGFQQILPYIKYGGSALLSGLSITSRFFLSFALKASRSALVISPLPIILYILAPVIVLTQVLLDVFVLLPYRLMLYILDAFYPLYVFLGVACLTGALVGLLGRVVTKLVVDLAKNGHKGAGRELEMKGKGKEKEQKVDD